MSATSRTQGRKVAFIILATSLAVSSVTRPLTGQVSNSFQTVHPLEISTSLPNDYMGWGLWAGAYNDFTASRYGQKYSVSDNTTKFGDDAPLFSWVLVDWPWAQAEPEEGQFEWSRLNAIIRYWSSRNKRIVLRFWVTDDPGWNGKPGGVPCPNWIWKRGVRYREYIGNGGVKRREPDYADPSFKRVYLPELQRLLASFAVQYDRPNSPIALLQVMGYGHWADWATWYSHYRFPSLVIKHQILSEIMDLYLRTFRHIQLMEMADRDWNPEESLSLNDQLYSKALDLAVNHHFGLEWTGFIDGLGGWDRDIMEKYWREDPIFAEGNWCYEDMKAQRIHGTPDENLDVALFYHANYAHFYTDAVSYKQEVRLDPHFLDRGLQAGGLGYRLVPVSLSWREDLPAGDLMLFKQTWVNRNVGRLYVRHPLKLYLMDEQGHEKFSEVDTGFDETSWVRGETYPVMTVFHIPKTLAPGIYDIRIALVNAAGTPRIRLGIAGEDSELRYQVGRIRIRPSEAGTSCDKAYCP